MSLFVPKTKVESVEKETSNEFFFWKIGTSCVLASFSLLFADILFSREVEYLKRRRVAKYLKNLRVLILEFYPYFSHIPFFNKKDSIF